MTSHASCSSGASFASIARPFAKYARSSLIIRRGESPDLSKASLVALKAIEYFVFLSRGRGGAGGSAITGAASANTDAAAGLRGGTRGDGSGCSTTGSGGESTDCKASDNCPAARGATSRDAGIGARGG